MPALTSGTAPAPGASPAASAPSTSPLAVGLAAARANLLPAVILWGVGVLILVAWFFIPTTHHWLVQLGHVKQRFGYAYSMVGMAVFAGVIPFFMQGLTRDAAGRRRQDLTMLVFLTIFWALKGIEVDALYRLQSLMFGNGHDGLTLTEKIIVDQFIYCPLWAVPMMTLALTWVQQGLTRNPWPRRMGFARWYVRRVLPVLISNWFVWVPSVAVIYTMPPALQLPIQNLVVCLFVLLALVMTRHDDPSPDPLA